MQNVRQSHAELYKMLKYYNDNDLKICYEDIYDLYVEQVIRPKIFERTRWQYRGSNYFDLDADQRRKNAMNWFKGALISLIKHGFIGLTFNEQAIEQVKPVHIKPLFNLVA